jgi:hypothetical protein
MNNIAISPHIFMYALQNQNVERKIAKKIDIKILGTNNNQVNSNEIINGTNSNDVNNNDVIEDVTKVVEVVNENVVLENTIESNNVTSIDNSMIPTAPVSDL